MGFIGNQGNPSVSADLQKYDNSGSTSITETTTQGAIDNIDDRVDTTETKLATIEDNAQVNVNADWDSVSGDSEILNKPDVLLKSGGTVSGSITVDALSVVNDLSVGGNIDGVDITALGTTVTDFIAEKAAVNGIASLDALGRLNENVDASKIIGTIDTVNLPAGALERLITVTDESARFALTDTEVQLGDTVKQNDTGILYYVVNESELGNSAGYVEYTAGTATNVNWTGIIDKPNSVISLTGDVTGSATMTALGSTSIAVTVQDDSHDHIIANVDGLQTALDAKQNNLIEGPFVDGDKTKLDGIESGAEVNPTDAEIKTAYENNANTEVFTTSEKTMVDVGTSITTTASTIPTAINELNTGISDLKSVIGTTSNSRYDKLLSTLDVIEMDYTSGNLDYVRYTGDNGTNMYYRDVMAYDVNGNLTEVGHFYGTVDLVTASGTTTLSYDGNNNLITATYTE
jgi:hypothetical protein